MIVAETALQLLQDPNHWIFEAVTDLVFGAAGAVIARPLIRRAIRRHDERNH